MSTNVTGALLLLILRLITLAYNVNKRHLGSNEIEAIYLAQSRVFLRNLCLGD